MTKDEAFKRRWNIDACKAYAEQLRDKTRANTAEHAAEAIEFLLQVYQDQDDTLTIAYQSGYYDGKKAAQPAQEPVAWADLQKEAQQIVESKFLWKKFIDGTPLSNDIACWMADFAQQYTTPPQPAQEPWRESASDYERGFIDGMQKQSQSSVDKAVNAMTQRPWVGLTDEEIKAFDTWHDNREEEVGWCNPSEIVAYIDDKLRSKNT